MPEVFLVRIHIEPPSPRCPGGRNAEAYFTFVDDVVTVTDKNGQHVRDDHGKIYSRKLEPPHNTQLDAELNAGRLFRDFISAMRGNSSPRGFSGGGGGFSGPINYPRDGGIV